MNTRVFRSFDLGQLVVTAGALAACSSGLLMSSLTLHAHGDWGCICDEDKLSNDEATIHGLRILSAYPIDPALPCEGFGKNTLWIVTEADRSVTTFLLPDEY